MDLFYQDDQFLNSGNAFVQDSYNEKVSTWIVFLDIYPYISCCSLRSKRFRRFFHAFEAFFTFWVRENLGEGKMEGGKETLARKPHD